MKDGVEERDFADLAPRVGHVSKIQTENVCKVILVSCQQRCRFDRSSEVRIAQRSERPNQVGIGKP